MKRLLYLLPVVILAAGGWYAWDRFGAGDDSSAPVLGEGIVIFAVNNAVNDTGTLYALDLSSNQTTALARFAWVVREDWQGRQRQYEVDSFHPFDLSPDLRHIAYRTGDHYLATVDISTGESTQLLPLAPDDSLDFVVWSPDGSQIAFVQNGDLHTVNTVSRASQLVDTHASARYTGTTFEYQTGILDPMWTGDGQGLLYIDFSAPGTVSAAPDFYMALHVAVRDEDGSGYDIRTGQRLDLPGDVIYSVLPAQNRAIVRAGSLFYFLDLSDVALNGETDARQVSLNLDNYWGTYVWDDPFRRGMIRSWSPDGTMLAYYDRKALSLKTLDIESGEERAVIALDPHGARVAWSPDATRIALAEPSDQSVALSTVSLADGKTAGPAVISLPEGRYYVLYLAWLDKSVNQSDRHE